MRKTNGDGGAVNGVSYRGVLRRVIFSTALTLAAGTCLSTSATALATPLGPWLPSPPADLSVTGKNALNAQVAVGPDGTTTVTWQRHNNVGKNSVQVATRSATATTFSAPINLSNPYQNASNPHVAVGSDGKTTIVWLTAGKGGKSNVQAATRAAGATKFSAPIDLSTPGQNADRPQIAVGPHGITTITWSRTNGHHYVVQATTRAAGATKFSTPTNVSKPDASASAAKVAIGPDGTTVIIWARSLGMNELVQASTRAAGATKFSTPVAVSSPGVYGYDAQVAVGPHGITTITWTRYFDGLNSTPEAATRAANATTFSTPVVLSAPGEGANSPQVAIGPDGTSIITWSYVNGTNVMVRVAMCLAGSSTYSTPIDLSAPGQDAFNQQIAVGPDGTTTIAWVHRAGQEIVQATTRDAGTGVFSTPIDLSAPGQSANGPQVAIGANGTTGITWQRSDGTNTIVQAVTARPNR